MGPTEIGLILGVVVLLFGSKLFPKWGHALGETFGYIRGKGRKKND